MNKKVRGKMSDLTNKKNKENVFTGKLIITIGIILLFVVISIVVGFYLEKKVKESQTTPFISAIETDNISSAYDLLSDEIKQTVNEGTLAVYLQNVGVEGASFQFVSREERDNNQVKLTGNFLKEGRIIQAEFYIQNGKITGYSIGTPQEDNKEE